MYDGGPGVGYQKPMDVCPFIDPKESADEGVVKKGLSITDMPTCEYVRDTYSDVGKYWFMRCTNCAQQSNERLIMADYWNYCCHCGAWITRKEGESEWHEKKDRREL